MDTITEGQNPEGTPGDKLKAGDIVYLTSSPNPMTVHGQMRGWMDQFGEFTPTVLSGANATNFVMCLFFDHHGVLHRQWIARKALRLEGE